MIMVSKLISRNSGLFSNESGFTIIEAIMSVAIFSLGMLAYGVTSGSIMDKNIKSTKKSIATTIAQDQIENIKTQAFSYLLVVPGDTTEVTTDVVDEEGETGGADAKYTRNTTITRLSGFPCNCYYEVEVVVSWVNQGFNSIQLNTTISQ
jgi:type II secretory pathway pseudopilin PulG